LATSGRVTPLVSAAGTSLRFCDRAAWIALPIAVVGALPRVLDSASAELHGVERPQPSSGSRRCWFEHARWLNARMSARMQRLRQLFRRVFFIVKLIVVLLPRSTGASVAPESLSRLRLIEGRGQNEDHSDCVTPMPSRAKIMRPPCSGDMNPAESESSRPRLRHQFHSLWPDSSRLSFDGLMPRNQTNADQAMAREQPACRSASKYAKPARAQCPARNRPSKFPVVYLPALLILLAGRVTD